MSTSRSAFVLLCLLAVAGLAHCRPSPECALDPASLRPAVNATLAAFFSLFKAECAQWAGTFTPTASFAHPKVPTGVRGRDALQAFCSKNQEATAGFPVEFRQDGGAMITPMQTETSLDGTGRTLEAHVLVPYLYAAGGAHNSQFINSGWESLVLQCAGDALVIAHVTEFFKRETGDF
eukprot:CAMPEP_0177644036 /NCGR_PEP_ID=MMETSP0447-20121125/8465_1 /TAXON_ID=0 /ORGANISM="Stygamoeba regulata, Strain BSH-02190019" /LENGTH=177 /DNA_ID=CAMNT_0019146353 /DNA_START=103 /DNA_END=633 /DNA_ORIENTATION=-